MRVGARCDMRHDIPMLSVGDLVRDMATQRRIRPTRSNLHRVSQQVLQRHGAGFFARLLIARIQDAAWDAVGITGIRTPADSSAFRGRFGDDFVLIHVQAGDARIHFERVKARDEVRDPDSHKRFVRQDSEEEEVFDIQEAAARADITIENDGSLEDFHRSIEEQIVEPLLVRGEQG